MESRVIKNQQKDLSMQIQVSNRAQALTDGIVVAIMMICIGYILEFIICQTLCLLPMLF